MLSQLSAVAQDAGPVTPAQAVGLMAPPPARRWVVSAGPFNPISGLIPNLRFEHALRPQLSVALEGAFRQYNFSSFSGVYPDRFTSSSLSAGGRYYFADTAPKGFYLEALAGVQYHHIRYGDHGGGFLYVRPELGAGYQFLIGKRRRFVADLGVRFYSTQPISPRNLPKNDPPYTRLRFIPSVRIGFAF